MVASFIAAAAPLVTSAISAFSGGSNGYDNWFTAHPVEGAVFQATLQNQMQKELMQNQYEYNSALAMQQFEHNKYFTEHGHQAEVQDLRNAGLNPILSANNGAYSQVGLGSVSSGQANSPDILGASSARSQAKLQAQMNRMSMLDVLSNIEQKSANSALQREQAKTESYRGANVAMDTDLKASQIAFNNINTAIGQIDKQLREYQNLTKEERWKLEKQKFKLEQQQVAIANYQAQTQRYSAMSQAELNKHQGKLVDENARYTRKITSKFKSINVGGFGINFGYSN